MGTTGRFASLGALCLSLMGPTDSFGLLIEDGVTLGNGGGVVIGGETYYPMTADWWQWALSYPSSTSPMLDTDGSRAHVGDRGSVFFVAGSFVGSPVVRTFDVPLGKPLFFPMANNIGVQDLATDTEASLRALAAPTNIADFQASLDGTSIKSQATRQKSPAFTLESPLLPDLGLCYPAACPSTYTGLAVSDGYWLTLAPLSRGAHTIKFGATFTDGSSLDITAYVNAVPEPGTYALMLGGLGLFGWWASRRKSGR